MSSPTELKLPTSLPYPIKLVSLAAQPNTDVQRGTRLLDYSFAYVYPDGRTEPRFGTWDSPLEGTLTRWAFKNGEVIQRSRAEASPAVYILEPCKHGIVFGGLCGICGKDLTRCVSPPFPRLPRSLFHRSMRSRFAAPAGLTTWEARWTRAGLRSP